MMYLTSGSKAVNIISYKNVNIRNLIQHVCQMFLLGLLSASIKYYYKCLSICEYSTIDSRECLNAKNHDHFNPNFSGPEN